MDREDKGGRVRFWVATGVSACLGLSALNAAASELVMRRADAAYAERSLGGREGQATPEAANAAVAAAEAALAAAPTDLGAHWRLARALHFLGEFATREKAAKRAVFERAIAASEHGLDVLAERTGGARLETLPQSELPARLARAGVARGDAGALYFWAAVARGAWSQTVGLLDAARAGVTDRLHDYTRLGVELSPEVYDGGPLRLWARMHTILPRVPLLTSWVDRSLALPAAERALAIAPEHPGNQVLFAMTLLDLEPKRTGEALAILRGVAQLAPRPAFAVEDEAVRALAMKRLAEQAKN